MEHEHPSVLLKLASLMSNIQGRSKWCMRKKRIGPYNPDQLQQL